MEKTLKQALIWMTSIIALALAIALIFKIGFFECLFSIAVSVLLLFIPGFLLLHALPKLNEKLDLIERICLSIAFSFALVSIIFFYAHFTGWGIMFPGSLLVFGLMISVLGYFAYKNTEKKDKKEKHSKNKEQYILKILLALFILFAIVLNVLPRITYEYPRHVDEWIHFQYASHLSLGTPLYLGGVYTSLEAGFHSILAAANSLGIDYLFIFRIFPSILTLLLCLVAFVLTRKLSGSFVAGLFAVIFIGVLPGSNLLLGPAYLVPMALGMAFLLSALFLIEIDSKLWFLILASAFLVHPPTALAMLIAINIKFLFVRKGFWKNAGYQVLAFLIALPMYLPVFLSMGLGASDRLFSQKMVGGLPITRIMGGIGLPLVIFGGIIYLWKNKFSLVISSLSLILLVLLEDRLGYDIFIPSTRIMMYLAALFSIFFGIGAGFLVDIWKNKKVGAFVFILLVVLTLIFAMPIKIKAYGSFSTIAYGNGPQAFSWIKENTDKNAIILCDPLESHAVTPLAGRQVFARSFPTANMTYAKNAGAAYSFMRGECRDEAFMRENNLSIIYGECYNSNLTQVYPSVYVLK